MAVLVTGGAGYIGSHTCVELLVAGQEIVIVDNLKNSKLEAVNRIKEISGKELAFYKVDLLDKEALRAVFEKHKIDSVIHFAGLKAVGESVSMPLQYYHNNITGTLVLCELMQEYGVKKLVFSSSATVYGDPASVPITEDFPLSTTNPYGTTKLFVEQILRDLFVSDNTWSIVLLRYFNPIGAHKCGRIGEDPHDIPNNLLPFIAQVAVGKLEKLNIYGNNYNTVDGTGVRDYIHVVDLSIGHLKALDKANKGAGVFTYNLGTGKGYSVLQVVEAYKKASGQDVPYAFSPRRPGDIAECYADPIKAKTELGWQATRELAEMCEDSWRWQSNNPNGYEE
ncbi:MAG: UDP-glucose 4-epimerase GalE [Bacillota bacterium]